MMTQMVSELTQQVSKLTGSAYPPAAAASVGVRDSYACDPQLFEGDLVNGGEDFSFSASWCLNSIHSPFPLTRLE